MKIAEKNGFFSISFGAMDSTRNENGTQGKARNKGLSVFAGDLRQNTETAIERKRKEIREKAVKVLQDKFDSDTKWSENIEESKERIQGAWDTIKEAKDNIAQVNEHIENAEDMDQGTYLGYQKYIAEQNRLMQEAQNTITGENAGIRSAKQDKLGERYRITDAVVAEEKIFAAGSDEIQGMLRQEAQEHIDEMYAENIEKAQEQKEKKEEEQERLDAIKEKGEQIQEQVEAAKENAKEEQVESSEEANETIAETNVDEELRKVQEEGELLEEELKGLMVDTKL